MVTILMISAKMATQGLVKLKVFWNKDYYVIISVHDVTNKTLSHDSHYIVDVLMWPKFGNSSISMREVITTSILQGFFEGWSWFKFNNLGVALGTTLNFYTSVAKGLKLKVRKLWCLILTFVEVAREKLVGAPFCPHPHPTPSWIGLRKACEALKQTNSKHLRKNEEHLH